jgi:alpha-L-fucosidase
MLPQMKDLVTRYQPDILWTDGEWEQSAATWQSKEFLTWLFNESGVKNSVMVNDRWGNDARGKFTACIQTSEYGSGTVTEKRVWEETRGIGASFGYNRNESLEEYASSAALIKQLIQVVARGGNLLLNIGPNADGAIPVIMQQRLKDIGDWLKINGEAIYNTVVWKDAPPITKDSDLFFTANEKNVYAIATGWKDTIRITTGKKPTFVELLGYNGKIKYRFVKNTLLIFAPSVSPARLPCSTAWAYKISFH